VDGVRGLAVERKGRRVGFGSGAAGALIAVLSRRGLLGRIDALVWLPRRVVRYALRHAQGLSVYRRVGRRAAIAFEIVEAREPDLQAVHRLYNAHEAYRRSEPDPHVTNWVAKVGGHVAGFVQLTARQPGGSAWGGHWLFSLIVQPRFRGLGIGEALTLKVVAKSAADGSKDLRLAVFEDNLTAIALYAKLGFEPITVDALEPGFAEEQAQTGRRRIVMCKRMGTDA